MGTCSAITEVVTGNVRSNTFRVVRSGLCSIAFITTYTSHYTSTSITLLLHIITYTSPTYCAIRNYLYYCSHLSYLLHKPLTSLTSITTITPLLLTPFLPTSQAPYLSYLYYHYYSITAYTSPTYHPLPLLPLSPTHLCPIPLLYTYMLNDIHIL